MEYTSASSLRRKGNISYSHAVSRSVEFLSCAKTVLKIAKSRWQQQQAGDTTIKGNEWSENVELSDLELYDPTKHLIGSPLTNILEDALSLLRSMEIELAKLDSLVRRRGHSNDPTHEISVAVAAIESDAAELTAVVQAMDQRGSVGFRYHQQRQRHIKVIQEWFQTVAQQYAARLKDVLAVRASVLTDQAKRRGMFQATNNEKLSDTTSGSTLTIDNAFGRTDAMSAEAQQALFAPLPPRLNSVDVQQHAQFPGSNTSHTQLSAPASGQQYQSTYYGNGAGGRYSSDYSYGGNGRSRSTPYEQIRTDDKDSGGLSQNGGMRRRKQPTTTVDSGSLVDNNDGRTDVALKHQFAALEQRQRDRQTATRLKEARQAEQSLAALGTVFGKMSTLISQQSETLSKIEDDVEAAHFDVNAGHEEITTLYAIKKGNRMLIIKVFCLLNFLIVFMRFYVRK
jgi:hypothetical protein